MEWMEELVQKAKWDVYYQQMLEKTKGKEAKFLKVRNSLPAEYQQSIDDYISCCEELDHILTWIAYNLGRKST